MTGGVSEKEMDLSVTKLTLGGVNLEQAAPPSSSVNATSQPVISVTHPSSRKPHSDGAH